MGEETKFGLKLLVDTRANKVLFGEAGKDFVDFLFYIMLLPLGTIVKLLMKMKDGENVKIGCLGELYRSIEAMSGTDYMIKDAVFRPTTSLPPPNTTTMLLLKEDGLANPPSQRKFYLCPYCLNNYVCDSPSGVCPNCNRIMSREINYVAPKSSSSSTPTGGYVQGVVTYMVMDNLEVKPMSTISTLSLISKFHVKGAAPLVEKHVQVGFHEGMRILKALLESQAVLTTAFLENDCLP